MCDNGCGANKVEYAQTSIYPSTYRFNDDQNESIQALHSAAYQLRQQANLLDTTNEYVRAYIMSQEVLNKNQKTLIIDVLSKLT